MKSEKGGGGVSTLSHLDVSGPCLIACALVLLLLQKYGQIERQVHTVLANYGSDEIWKRFPGTGKPNFQTDLGVVEGVICEIHFC